jgi:hypothetical protein
VVRCILSARQSLVQNPTRTNTRRYGLIIAQVPEA